MPAPTAVQPCLDRAVLRAGAIVQRAGTAALEALQADNSRRDAARELQQRLPAWRNRYGELLRHTLDNPAPAAGVAAADSGNSGNSGFNFNSLTLVDDTQVLQSIESTRLAQQITAKLERPLSEAEIGGWV